MSALQFTVPGPPVGKGRARIARRGAHARMYTPEATASYESLVGLSAHTAMGGRPMFDGAVSVSLDIRVPIPASWSERKKQAALSGAVLPVTKPDIDNCEKAIFDGLNGIAWRDDVLVVAVSKRKRYAREPGVLVVITPEGTC